MVIIKKDHFTFNTVITKQITQNKVMKLYEKSI